MNKLEILNNFILEINPFYEVFEDEYFSSDWRNLEVYVYLGNKELEGDKEYIDFIKKEYNFQPNNFIISFLHEIGHLETETQRLSDNRAIEYATLEYAFENNLITREQLFDKYFKIEAEILATNWAVNYYKNNEEKINKLIKTIDII